MHDTEIAEWVQQFHSVDPLDAHCSATAPDHTGGGAIDWDAFDLDDPEEPEDHGGGAARADTPLQDEQPCMAYATTSLDDGSEDAEVTDVEGGAVRSADVSGARRTAPPADGSGAAVLAPPAAQSLAATEALLAHVESQPAYSYIVVPVAHESAAPAYKFAAIEPAATGGAAARRSIAITVCSVPFAR